jgi:hypothetical protein
MHGTNRLVFNIEGGNYIESLLISAVATILSIRFYLEFTGYPKIGGGGLHIAHMLWGGLLMLSAIFILLLFLNRPFLHLAAIIGGVGFGTFIDELGKFITNDNNYFFQPTSAIIYLIFVVLFLSLRILEKYHKFSQEEYIENAFELTRQAFFDKTASARDSAFDMLEKIEQSTSVVKELKSILSAIVVKEYSTKNIFSRIKTKNYDLYKDMMENRFFLKAVVVFFIIFSLYNLWKAIDVIVLVFKLSEFSLTYIEWGKFLSSVITSSLVIVGIISFKFSSVRGYKMLKLGVLFSLFVTEFFDFYDNQIAAASVFIINVLILITLNTILKQKLTTLKF